ncbi:MAG: hypothetical protein Q9191_001290 [Dirinaria sp. TL-2023a]
MANIVQDYGWSSESRDLHLVLSSRVKIKEPRPLLVQDIDLPETTLIKGITDRPDAYPGKAIQMQHFPNWTFTDETYLLACLLHDIGTTDTNLQATLMSFEFYGGFLALNLLQNEHQAPKAQAESVAEAIIRHQDLGESGKITTLGLYNMGMHPELVHQATIEDVVKHYPRKGWSSCFAATIRKENSMKPWAHTTALGEEDFPNGVQNNQLMAPYDV